jgi:hypothetical protein
MAKKPSNNNPQGYEVESNGKLEYVVVRCPKGHRLRGMKVGDMMVRQEVSCPECKWTRTVLAPMTNGMEAYI